MSPDIAERAERKYGKPQSQHPPLIQTLLTTNLGAHLRPDHPYLFLEARHMVQLGLTPETVSGKHPSQCLPSIR
jgi:hypothetical protein